MVNQLVLSAQFYHTPPSVNSNPELPLSRSPNDRQERCVMNGIGLHVHNILVSLVLSIIISWTFRILAHEENQYTYVYKILGQFPCLKHLNRRKPGLGVRELLS